MELYAEAEKGGKMKKLGIVLIFLSIIFFVCKKPDEESPEVKITNPTDSATVSGVVNIKVDATDNDMVERMEFYIDGSIANIDTSAPYEYGWNTIGLSDSSYHTILVNGYDPADNIGSDSITVLVRKTNSPPNIPSNPVPADGDTGQLTSITFHWKGGDPDEEDTVKYDFYLGTDSIPPVIEEDFLSDTIKIDTLKTNTTYYWMVRAEDNHGAESQGPVWSFTTKANKSPNTPSNPSPSDGATDVSLPIILSWTGGDPDPGDTVKYDVYLGTDASPPKVVTDHPDTSYSPSGMKYNTKYYWKIVARDNYGDTAAGSVWSFKTPTQPEEMEIKYDDGEPEAFWLLYSDEPGEREDDQAGWCMKMTPPSHPFTLTKVKFYFYEVSYDFYLHVYKDEYGTPGSNLLHTPYRIDAMDVPWEDWWTHDVSSENVVIESGDFYVGFCYSYVDVQDGPSVSIGADESPPFDDRAWVNLGEGWDLFSGYGSSYRYDLMIRAIGYIGGVASPKKEIEIIPQEVRVFKPKGKIKAKFMSYPKK